MLNERFYPRLQGLHEEILFKNLSEINWHLRNRDKVLALVGIGLVLVPESFHFARRAEPIVLVGGERDGCVGDEKGVLGVEDLLVVGLLVG